MAPCLYVDSIPYSLKETLEGGLTEFVNSTIEDENSHTVKDNAKHNFESLSIMVREPARDYVARAKGLASAVKPT